MKKKHILLAFLVFITLGFFKQTKFPLHAIENDLSMSNIFVTSGKNHSLFKSSENEIFAWGSWGDVSVDTSIDSIDLIKPTNITNKFSLQDKDYVISLGSGDQHSFVTTYHGRVFAFGFDGQGQLGDGGEVYYVGDSNYESQLKKNPVEITSNFSLDEHDKIIKVVGGSNFSIALSNTGRVFTFGQNNSGQLGNNDLSVQYSTIPLEITSNFSLSEEERIIDISSGAAHALAITNNGKLYTWGNNNFGQLGDGTLLNQEVPTLLEIGNEKITKIECGRFHSYVLTNLYQLYGFGYNGDGQMADSAIIIHSGNDKHTPYEMSKNFSLETNEVIVDIYSGFFYGMAISSSKRVFSYGQNSNGQIGDKTNISRSYPKDITANIPLSSEDSIATLALGEKHSIGVSCRGEVYSWGDNSNGQLGEDLTLGYTFKPTPISNNFPPIIKISKLGSMSYLKEYEILIEAFYMNSLAVEKINYLWTKSNSITPSDSDNWQKINNGETITLSNENGIFYLWVKVLDKEEQSHYRVSNAFLIDNKSPTMSITKLDNSAIKNDEILSQPIIVKVYDENENPKILYSLNESDFVLIDEQEYVFEQDGRYTIKAIDSASNESETFSFLIDTISPSIVSINEKTVAADVVLLSKSKAINIETSEKVMGYILNDNKYIDALNTSSASFSLEIEKGVTKIKVVDLSGKISETYLVEYNPTFFEDTEMLLIVFGTITSILIILVVIVYVIKSRKQIKRR